ncbi:guanine nucleotide binding protein, alpha subunit [Gorgonomyces haynaldii]|nr:guanine nucleotide binding protein, alpha subunit [Gorgonomyces haynaldii]
MESQDAPRTKIDLKEQYRRSQDIDRQLIAEARERAKRKDCKLLLLGAGDSGKTTILRQLVLLHGNGFSQEERLSFKTTLFDNIVSNLINLLQQTETDYKQKYQELANYMELAEEDRRLSPSLLQLIQEAWALPEVQQVFENPPRGVFVQDSVEFFLKDLERICDPAYLPSDQDIMYVRRPTQSISETFFNIDNKSYVFYDVAGQRDKRYRWAPYFENMVDGIVYVASAAAYCQNLEEDISVNRMLDQMALFETIAHNPCLEKSNMILFLNKVDLLPKRLKSYPVKIFLPSYNGPNEPKHVLVYLANEFQRILGSGRKLHVHITTGTDTKTMKKIIYSTMFLNSF